MPFGALVALHQVLRRVRPLVGRVRVVAPAQLERIDVELSRELVEQGLEPERPFDETRCAERLHRRRVDLRSEEHTSELQSRPQLVCRLLLEKKNDKQLAE